MSQLGRGRWWAISGIVALVVIVCIAVIASTDSGAPTAQACPTTSSDCVEVGIGQPIYLATMFRTDSQDGTDASNAVQMAVDYLDGRFDGLPGTLLGHPVSVLPTVDGCAAPSGIAAAHQIIAQSDVLGVVAANCSASMYKAADAVLSAAHLLTISPQASSVLLTDPKEHQPYFFRTARNDLIQGSLIADFIHTHPEWTRVGIISTNDAYSSVLGAAITSDLHAAGGTATKLIIDAAHPARSVETLATFHPSAVVLPLNGKYCLEVLKALHQTPQVPVVMTQQCQQQGVLDYLRNNGGSQVYATGPDASELAARPFNADTFLPAYQRLFGYRPLTIYSPAAFDATNLIFDAIRRVAVVHPGGGLMINRVALREALLHDVEYQGLSDVLSCSPTGDCVPATRMAVYRAPQWPVGGNPLVSSVFSETKVLQSLLIQN